jgi:hypothetical protein
VLSGSEEGGPQKPSDYINDREWNILTNIREPLGAVGATGAVGSNGTANDMQVGGRHYQSSYQHWDFVRDLKLDYFQGCATKYLTRRKGNRKEDLQKAIHFLNKKWENLEENTPCQETTLLEDDMIEQFCYANNLTVMEHRAITWICNDDYYMAIEVIKQIIEREAW